MSNKLEKQKNQLLFFAKQYEEEPLEYTPQNQDLLRMALSEALKIIVELLTLEIDKSTEAWEEEKNQYEELINGLQEKIIEQDEIREKMAETFDNLSKMLRIGVQNGN